MLKRARSEFQTGLAGGISQRSHAAVVFVLTTIENHLLDAGLDGSLGNRFAHSRRGRPVSAVANFFSKLGVLRAGAGQGPARLIVNDLGVNILMAAEDAQPRPQGISLQPVAHANCPSLALSYDSSFVFHGLVSPQFFLTGGSRSPTNRQRL